MKSNLAKYKVTVISILSGFLFACSSSPKNSTEREVQTDTKDFIVRERYPAIVPEWAKNFSQFKVQNEGHGQYYFIGESGDVNDRIAGCDIAVLSAKKKIAQQIAEFITNKVALGKSGRLNVDKDESNANQLGHYYSDTLAGKSVAFLSGVKEYANYWEERDYSSSGGKKRVYQCNTVVVIDEKSLFAAIKKSSAKFQDSIDDQEAKTSAKEALKNIDKEFEDYHSQDERNLVENTGV